MGHIAHLIRFLALTNKQTYHSTSTLVDGKNLKLTKNSQFNLQYVNRYNLKNLIYCMQGYFDSKWFGEIAS